VAVLSRQVLLSRACWVCRSRRRARRPCRFLRRCNEPFPDRLFAGEFPGAAYGLRLFPGCPLRRFLIETPLFHLSKDAFALHFLFQDTERLVDIVVSNQYLQGLFPFGEEGTLRCDGKSRTLNATDGALILNSRNWGSALMAGEYSLHNHHIPISYEMLGRHDPMRKRNALLRPGRKYTMC
jgi:hypothetical protein